MMLSKRQKIDIAIGAFATVASLIIVILTGTVVSNILDAKDACINYNGTYEWNLSGNFCDNKKLIKQEDGEWIFYPNFDFTVDKKWG